MITQGTFHLGLKSSIVVADLTWEGTPFQSQGAATEKALSAFALSRDWGIERVCWEEDPRDLRIEWGANPFRALKTNSKILNSILYLTGPLTQKEFKFCYSSKLKKATLHHTADLFVGCQKSQGLPQDV